MKSLLVVLMLVSATANAEWTYVSSADDSSSSYYIDIKTIKKTASGHRTIWNMTNFNQSSIDGHLSSKALYEFSCNEDKYKILQITGYSGKSGTGKSIGTDGQSDWMYVIPGSTIEPIQSIVCGR